MKNLSVSPKKWGVFYYLSLFFLLFVLFFSNDFNLTDVQKTAVIMAVGVDREEEEFILTSQIALPQSSKQGKQTQTVQLVSTGKTVADAFKEINAKTGWYPKLVFCHLIILGETTVQQNSFDALDFFLLDEYLSDNCLVATCEGSAKDLLNVGALVDPSGSVAMEKVLSAHAERVGAVLPATLREFAIGYYSSSQSAYLPILKTKPQQETGKNQEKQGGTQGDQDSKDSKESQGGKSGGQSQSGQSSQSDSQGGGQNGQGSQSGNQGQSKEQENKPVFSASETALFVQGKMVGKFSKEETFAFNAVKTKLRLASYLVAENGATTLTIKDNRKQTRVQLGENGQATMKISLNLTAGLLDTANSALYKQSKDAGAITAESLQAAEKLLKSQVITAFEKCRTLNCDLFELKQTLLKRRKNEKISLNSALENCILQVEVRFKNLR